MMELLVDSPKPVVVTGAQRNFDVKDADGPRNILNAVRIAADPAADGSARQDPRPEGACENIRASLIRPDFKFYCRKKAPNDSTYY
jgi:hypothetical protein